MKCQRESQLPKIFRVSASETVVIPPFSEAIIKGNIKGDMSHIQQVIIEPLSPKLAEMGLIVGKSVVHTDSGQVPLRVLNPGSEEIKLYKHTDTATCEVAKRIIPVLDPGIPVAEVPDTLRNIKTTENDVDVPEHLRDLWESTHDKLSPEQQNIVRKFLWQYRETFAKSKNDLGCTDIVKHKIDTGNSRPIKQQPRRLPLAKREMVEAEIKRMLEQGIIEKSSSSWSAPIVLVEKKDKSIRFCCDYRLLNSVTVRDVYPIPRIDETLDTLKGAQLFSTIDLQSGYHQVMLDDDAKEKSAFCTHVGLFQWRVLSFGLTNAPATFERMMEAILGGMHWTHVLVYLDDIIVFAADFQTHIQRLSEVFSRLSNAGLKINAKKCQLFRDSVSFLGHIVSSSGISTDPEKISAVKNWGRPQNIHDIRAFLGTTSYYRKFIKGYAHIAKPLHRLTEKNKTFTWDLECEKAFEALKEKLISAPVLAYPDTSKPFLLDCDASSFAVGAVLSQIHDDQEHPVAYYSRTLSRTERNYCVTRRELLAMVEAVKRFHHYLYGFKFKIRTDHGALNWLFRSKNHDGQLCRWFQVLATYDFEIEFRRGKLHGNC
ncbi:MAG: RNA-directed DNA polymerase, partial [Candidatus Thiodiazotropha sp. (ex Lucinoma borealis)]|nr:RNA-directed DNA polymerase [Candidatus Thiodiazotropha sp. (ex Lucinoma borealis)]